MSRRVLLGKFPDGNYGLRVSQPGVDVTTLYPNSNPGDNEELVFNSDWVSTLPIVASGEVYVGPGGIVEISYPDLGFTPFGAAVVYGPLYIPPGSLSGPSDGWVPYVTSNAFQSWGANDEANTYIALQFLSSYLYIQNGFTSGIYVGYVIYNVQAF